MVKKYSNSRKRSRNIKSLRGGGENMMCLPNKAILEFKEDGAWPNADGPGRINNCKTKTKDVCEIENEKPDIEEWNKCYWSNTYDTQFDELRELIKQNKPHNEIYKIFLKPDEDGEGDDDGEGDEDGEGDDDGDMEFGGGGRLRRKSRRKRKGQRKSRRSKRGRSRRNPRRNRRSRRR